MSQFQALEHDPARETAIYVLAGFVCHGAPSDLGCRRTLAATSLDLVLKETLILTDISQS